MATHFNSEHDMHAAVERRTHRPYVPHQQNWRAANDSGDDDALRAARGIWNGLCIGGALWALIAVCVWGLSMLWAQ